MKFLSRIFIFIFLIAGQLLHAQLNTDSLEILIRKSTQDTQRVRLLNLAADAYHDAGNETKAIACVKRVIALWGNEGVGKELGKAYETYALAVGDTGNFRQEIYLHRKSLSIFSALHDSSRVARIFNNIAYAHYYQGNYDSAAKYCLQSLHLQEKIKNEFGAAVSWMTMGSIYTNQKNYPSALDCFEKGLAISRRIKHDELTIRIESNMANIFYFQHDYSKAISTYRRVMDYFEKRGDELNASVVYNNLCSVYMDKGNLDSAEYFVRKSLAIREKFNDNNGIASSLINLGNIFDDHKKYDDAITTYLRSLALARSVNAKSGVYDAYQDLSESYMHKNDFKNAYRYLALAKDLNDSLLSEESAKTVADMQAQFNAEEQQQKIDFLTKENNEHLANIHHEEELKDERNRLMIGFLCAGIFAVGLLAFLFFSRSRTKQLVNEQLERQNAEITLQKNAITDSINYARRIQDSILPPQHTIRKILPDSFIFYAPKDVVSGDFFWVEEHDGLSIFAAVDCTGHGVPGALMSVVGFNLLNQAVNEMGITKPSDILGHLDYGVNKLLRQSDAGNTVKDGMDIALCTLDLKSRRMQFAGVFNPAYIITKGELVQIKADKFPIGVNVDGVTDTYTNNELQLFPGDMIYLFSDGFADQFGGTMGKKYKYNQFRELLQKIYALPVAEQHLRIKEEFENWRGNLEQVDDILVIGVRV